MSGKALNPTYVEFPVEPISKAGHLLAVQQIEVTVDGPQHVYAALKPTHGNKLLVSFTTTAPGNYTVNLKHKGEHLKLSPLSVNVSAKETGAQDQALTPLPEIPKHDVQFEVDAYDENGSFIPHSESFTIDVEGPDQVTPEVSREGDKIRISFQTYVSEGSFSVSVKHRGVHIQRSPFDIQLTPNDSQQDREYELTKQGKIASLQPLPAHREIQFTVLGRLRDGSYTRANYVVGTVISGEDSALPTRIEDDTTQPNTLKISFDALKPGKHKISVKFASTGQEIANSPFTITVPEEAFGRR